MYINVPTVRKKQKKKLFGFLKTTDEKSRIRSRIRNPVYGSKDPSPSQNVKYGSGTLVSTPEPH
jgi:hypothetical protein